MKYDALCATYMYIFFSLPRVWVPTFIIFVRLTTYAEVIPVNDVIYLRSSPSRGGTRATRCSMLQVRPTTKSVLPQMAFSGHYTFRGFHAALLADTWSWTIACDYLLFAILHLPSVVEVWLSKILISPMPLRVV